MRSLGLVLLVVSVSSAAFAAEKRLGRILATSPTAANNSTTAVPFTLSGNTKLSIQCDADVYIAVGTDLAALATADDVKVAAGQLFPTSTPNGVSASYVSVLPVAGAVVCRVFVRSGNEV